MTLDWPTVFEWAREIVMTVSLVLVWFIGRERKLVDDQIKALRAQLAALPTLEDLRRIFVARERMEDLLRESHDAHDALWDEIRRLRDRT